MRGKVFKRSSRRESVKFHVRKLLAALGHPVWEKAM
jgi:hypothetical protein